MLKKRDIAETATKIEEDFLAEQKKYEKKIEELTAKFNKIDTKLRPKVKKLWKKLQPDEYSELQRCYSQKSEDGNDVIIEYLDPEEVVKEYKERIKNGNK